MAAALAYFGLFAFVPLLYVAITVAGFFLNDTLLIREVFGGLERSFGTDATEFVQTMLLNTARRQEGGSLLAALIGLAVLLYIASGLFLNLEDMLNTIWRNPYPSQGGLLPLLRNQFLAFVLVIGVGFAFVAMTVSNFFLGIVGAYVGTPGVTALANTAVPFLLTALAFAVLYRTLARVKPSWRAISIGAFCAALMLSVGQWGFALYLQLGDLNGAFGAATALAVLLLGIYYVALIFLVGAMIIRVVPELWNGKPDVQ
jgi:membrane protein